MPGCAFTVLPYLTQHKVRLSQRNRTQWSGMHCLRDASSKGRDASSKEHKIQGIIQGHIVHGYNILSPFFFLLLTCYLSCSLCCCCMLQ